MEKMTSGSLPECIDWNEAWRTAQLSTSMRKRHSNMTDFWNMKAKHYNRMGKKGMERTAHVIDKLSVDDKTSIMDIGCGPGTLSIPLARVARSVTAIDPAQAMLDRLEEKAIDEGLSNITTINKKWEDVEVGADVVPHDVVVASYSLSMDDIREALSKMDAVAIRGVCLFWFAGRPTWGNAALWPKLFGEEFVAIPDYIYLLNVLYQMGIHPNVEITQGVHEQRFFSLADAIESQQESLSDLTPQQCAILREHIEETFKEENGEWWFRDKIKIARIWWQKETG